MAITLATGEALVGEGNEVAHIDLLLGSKSGPVGEAFAHAFVKSPKVTRTCSPWSPPTFRPSRTRF
jgi:formaldehyde-activating enzyme